MASREVQCPVASTLDLVGDRWTLLIVRDLLRGKSKFAELSRSVEGVTTSMLSDRLKRLEAEGVVARRMYCEYPPRAEYVLTTKGHALGVVVGALSTWGEQYTEHDRVLVDAECGHSVSVRYHCPTCDRETPRNRVRIVETEGAVSLPPLPADR